MVNCFFHLVNFGCQLVLLPTRDFIVAVTALSQRNLEILLSFLKFFLILIQFCRKLFKEVDDCSGDLLHFEIILFQVQYRVRDQRL